MSPERKDQLQEFALGELGKIKAGETSSFPSFKSLADQFGYAPRYVKVVLRDIGITNGVVEAEKAEVIFRPSLELAWILGLLSGAGSVGGADLDPQFRGRISLKRPDDPTLLKEFQRIGENLFRKKSLVEKNGAIVFFSTKIAQKMDKLRGDAWAETISQKHGWILDGSRYAWKFIEGLFDAKGTFQTKSKDNAVKHKALYVTTNNFTSANFIKDLLLSVGLRNPYIFSTIYPDEEVIYRVNVGNIADLKIIAENIRLKNQDQQNKLEFIKNQIQKVLPTKKELIYARSPLPPEARSSAIKRAKNFKSQIGKDERQIWIYAVEHGLIEKIIKAGMLTLQKMESIEIYWQTGIVPEDLTKDDIDQFTMAVANLA